MLSAGKDAVIIDTRNCYETRIGRFEAVSEARRAREPRDAIEEAGEAPPSGT